MTDVIIEYNDRGVQAFADEYAGAFARGKTEREALEKLPHSIAEDRVWSGRGGCGTDERLLVIERIRSDAFVEDGGTTALFASERLPMDMTEYTQKKALCLKSARDVRTLFDSIPQKDRALVKSRQTFYGRIPQTSREMLRHINDAIVCSAACADVPFAPCDDLVENRIRLFRALEAMPNFLENRVRTADDGELWTRKKLLRRILWHDRIHARAMYRKAITFWQKDRIKNPFRFFEA